MLRRISHKGGGGGGGEHHMGTKSWGSPAADSQAAWVDLGESTNELGRGLRECRALGMNVCADGKCGQRPPENPDYEKNRGTEAGDFLCLIHFAFGELSSLFKDEIHRLGGRSVKRVGREDMKI